MTTPSCVNALAEQLALHDEFETRSAENGTKGVRGRPRGERGRVWC